MEKRDLVSLIILSVLCTLTLVNTVWMVIINHPDMAIGSAVMFTVFFIATIFEFKQTNK